MSDWQSGFVESNGIRLHYTRTGGTKPPFVLAHGVTDDGLCWTPVAESLAGAIAGLGLRRPAILGHSIDAVTTLVLAAAYPDLPAAILLEDPPAWWATPAGSPTPGEDRRAGWRRRMHDLKRKTREELIADQRAEMPAWAEAELGPWADAKLRVSLNVLDLFSFDPAATVDWSTTLPRIACPALLISGDPARGAIVDQNAVEALRTMVKQLRVAHIPDAGHSIHRDQFDRFLEADRAFLKGA